MTTTGYGLPHILTGLLRIGSIDAAQDRDLYETLLRLRQETEAHLRPMGLELVIEPTFEIAVARVMHDSQLDAMAAEEDLFPIEPVVANNRISYWQSCACIILKTHLDRELHSGLEETWLERREITEQIKAYYAPSQRENDAAMTDRVAVILEALRKSGLADCRTGADGRQFWRGSKWLFVSLTRDVIDEFEARCTARLAEAGLPETAESSVLEDECPEAEPPEHAAPEDAELVDGVDRRIGETGRNTTAADEPLAATTAETAG